MYQLFCQQGDVYMAVFSGTLSRVQWTSHFFQGTRKTLPCLTGHSVLPNNSLVSSVEHKTLLSFFNPPLPKPFTALSSKMKSTKLILKFI